MTKERAIYVLKSFIKEMTDTLNDPKKKNRSYAPEVFWKNKYELELIVEMLEENK